MAWPKYIDVGGIRVPVDSWDEIREAIATFGTEITVSQAEAGENEPSPPNHRASSGSQGSKHLNSNDRVLLEQFVEADQKGVLTQILGPAVGKQGKGIRPALEAWSRRIGLVTEDSQSAFQPLKRFDGRAYRLHPHFVRTAKDMLR